MDNQFHEENANGDKYGVPISCRISGKLALEIAEEARLRGLTQSKYVANVLINAFIKSDDDKEQLELVMRERNLFREDLSKSEAGKAALAQKEKEVREQLQNYQNKYDPYAAIFGAQLENNRILKRHYVQHGNLALQKEILIEEGFDFSIMVSRIQIGDRLYNKLFEYAYTYLGQGLVQIESLDKDLSKNK